MCCLDAKVSSADIWLQAAGSSQHIEQVTESAGPAKAVARLFFQVAYIKVILVWQCSRQVSEVQRPGATHHWREIEGRDGG